jgi:hypothetical protein
MKIINLEDYPYVKSEWVVLIQEVDKGSWAEEQFLNDDPDQIIKYDGRRYGMRAILYVDYEHGVVQGWELTNLVYDFNGEERESGGEIRAELIKVIRDGTWDQELTYGDLGIGLHNFTVMNDLEEDWTDLPTPTYMDTFRLLVPEVSRERETYNSINYQQVPQ